MLLWKKLFRGFALFTLLLSVSCVEVYELAPSVTGKRLVVDGMITDQPGLHTVSLFYDTPVNGDADAREMVTDAAVFIVDESSVEVELHEVQPGLYKTREGDIRGMIGKSYFLKIIMDDGEVIQSRPEKILPVGDIDSAYFEYVFGETFPSGSPGKPDHVRIFINARNPERDAPFMRWRVTGTYQVETHPELHERVDRGTRVPDPRPCSGYVTGTGIRGITYVGPPCTCCVCWITERSSLTYISPTRLTSSPFLKAIPLHVIEFSSARFRLRYHVMVEQLSLSPELHEFWKLVRKQEQSARDLFQPNAVKVKGNLYSLTHPEREILGVFSASAIVSKSFSIHRADIPRAIDPEVIRESCLYLKNSTNEKPLFW